MKATETQTVKQSQMESQEAQAKSWLLSDIYVFSLRADLLLEYVEYVDHIGFSLLSFYSLEALLA